MCNVTNSDNVTFSKTNEDLRRILKALESLFNLRRAHKVPSLNVTEYK